MDDAAWSAHAERILNRLDISDEDRAAALADLNAIPAEAGMRGAPPDMIAAQLLAEHGEAARDLYLELRAPLQPFSPFTFMPLREVIISIMMDGHLAHPDAPLIPAANDRVRDTIGVTLEAPHFRMLLKASDGDLVDFFHALGSTDGFILDHGTMPLETDEGRLTLHFQGFYWAACRYFMPGFIEGIARHFGAPGEVQVERLDDTHFDITLEHA